MKKSDIIKAMELTRPDMFDLAIQEVAPVLNSLGYLQEREDFAISLYSAYYDRQGLVSWHFKFKVLRGGYLAEDIIGLSVGIALSSGKPLVKVLYHGQDRHNWRNSYQCNSRGTFLPSISYRLNKNLEFKLD